MSERHSTNSHACPSDKAAGGEAAPAPPSRPRRRSRQAVLNLLRVQRQGPQPNADGTLPDGD